MSIFYFLNGNNLFFYFRNCIKLSSYTSQKCSSRSNFSNFIGSTPSSKSISTDLSHLNVNIPFNITSQPNQIYKLLLDNPYKFDIFTTLKYVEILQTSKLSDPRIVNILSQQLLCNLDKLTTARAMSRFFRVLEPSSHLTDHFFNTLISYIYEKKIYPELNLPRVWTSYFKFLGSNRIYHKELYQDLVSLYNLYLNFFLSSSDPETSGDIVPNKRFQESIATVNWCLCICRFKDHTLYETVKKIIKTHKLDTSTLVRIYWSFSILNLPTTDLREINQLLNQTLENNSLYKLSHINQIYTILKSPSLSNGLSESEQEERNQLIETCKEYLINSKYSKNGKIISKSQKLVSDFLIRQNIPHQLEILTSDLSSVDIYICLNDEKIILEVDGPTHFIRNLDDPSETRKIGPCHFKEKLLKENGFVFISIPPIHSDTQNIKQIDEYYKELLQNSGSAHLNEIMKCN
uniref:RAP domain containing protein, putative n=1 Tax=Theileria annulata TaxID=5874 RepID=A0A3B0N7K5_THEAN